MHFQHSHTLHRPGILPEIAAILDMLEHVENCDSPVLWSVISLSASAPYAAGRCRSGRESETKNLCVNFRINEIRGELGGVSGLVLKRPVRG